MFGKYGDLIIIILTMGMGITIFSIIILLRAVASLSKESDKSKTENRKIEREISILRAAIARIFAIIGSNAESIVVFRQQMNQVHHWLGEVLSISNLIRNESDDDSKEIIEELRSRVRWDDERKKIEIDKNEYYEGD